jgi:hypothetical protein
LLPHKVTRTCLSVELCDHLAHCIALILHRTRFAQHSGLQLRVQCRMGALQNMAIISILALINLVCKVVSAPLTHTAVDQAFLRQRLSIPGRAEPWPTHAWTAREDTLSPRTIVRAKRRALQSDDREAQRGGAGTSGAEPHDADTRSAHDRGHNQAKLTSPPSPPPHGVLPLNVIDFGAKGDNRTDNTEVSALSSDCCVLLLMMQLQLLWHHAHAYNRHAHGFC